MLAIAAVTLLAAAPLAAPANTGAARVSIWVTAKGTGDRLASKEPVAFEPMPQPDEAFPTVMVDPSKAFQTIEGIGGALTDAAAETFAKLPKETAARGPRGVLRPRQGHRLQPRAAPTSTAATSRARATPTPSPATKRSRRSPSPPTAASACPSSRPRSPRRAAPVKIFASPWSPPAWMKTNGNMLQGGKLKPEYRDAWARYYARFVEEYEKEGVPIWGLTVQNEPMATQTWESCLFTGEEERDFVRDHLGPALERAGLQRLKLMIWDHNRGILYQRSKAVYDDPAAARYVWGAAFHWYVGDHFDNVRMVHDAWPDKHLLFTEGTPAGYDPATVNDWKWGEVYATSILRDLQGWASGWTDWNVLLDERGGPNHVGNFCFAPVHGDTRTGALTFTSAYYYIGHVSKFVRPGARRVATTTNDDDLLATAFVHPDGRLVAVVLNKTDADKDFALWVDGRAAKAKSPAHSIVTLTW